jgi:GAF domain-containing protein
MGKESDTTLDSLLETVAETQKLSPTPVLSLISVENYKRLFPAPKPLVTQQPDPVLINLFATATEIASAAFIPLLSRSRSIGILNLASPDAEKFVPGTATDAVEKLGRILATVIENNLLETRLLQLLESNPE